MQKEINIDCKDHLTGLWNELYFINGIRKYLQKNAAQSLKYAYIFFRIDHLHLFNQKFGSICGDQLLEDFSQQILTLINADDLASRIDSNVFAVFLKNVNSKNDILQLALKLRQLFFYLDAPSHNELTCSIGFSCYPDDLALASYEGALSALNFASVNGINKICFYEEGEKVFFQEVNNADNKELPVDIFRLLYEGQRTKQDFKQILSLIGEFYRADRVYIYKKALQSQCLQCDFAWNNKLPLPNLPWADCLEYMQHNLSEQDDFFYNNSEDMPTVMKKIIADEPVQNLYLQIIRKAGEFYGFIALEQYEESLIWTEEDLYRLKIIGQILAIFLA
ncbi:MAG: GGDEF domain-containing protein [bacterium]